MVGFGGWEMPLHFERGTLAEHMACRRGVALFDVSHLGTVRLSGPGAWERLQLSLTNDLRKIGPGKAQYTHLLDEDGSVLDDMIVWWVAAQRFDVVANAANTEVVREVLGGTDVTAERAVLAVQGPLARKALASVFPEAASVARSQVAELAWRGAPAVVAGTGYTGEDGVEIAVAVERAVALWEALVAAGAVPAGLGARDTLRLEAGLPLHGHELGPGISPLEAGLSWVVAWDKPGGFRGLAALEARRARGLAKKLVGVVGEGRQPLREGYEVELGGAVVGALTSGNYSPVLGRGIGMCFLPPSTGVGTELAVAARGRRLWARTVHLPFVRRGATGPLQAGAGGDY